MALQNQVDASRRCEALSRAEAQLLDGALFINLSPHATANPGMNSTYSGWLTVTQRVFHKPFSGVQTNLAYQFGQSPDDPPMNEVAAWRLARALGQPWDELVPPCVLREFVPQGPGSLQMGVTGSPADPTAFTVPSLVDAAAFWDCLVAQQDRHLGNYRWDAASGSLRLIDHGFCFAKPGDHLNASAFMEARHWQGRAGLSSTELELLRSLDHSPTLFGTEGILAPARALALRDRIKRLVSSTALLAPGDF